MYRKFQVILCVGIFSLLTLIFFQRSVSAQCPYKADDNVHPDGVQTQNQRLFAYFSPDICISQYESYYLPSYGNYTFSRPPDRCSTWWWGNNETLERGMPFEVVLDSATREYRIFYIGGQHDPICDTCRQRITVVRNSDGASYTYTTSNSPNEIGIIFNIGSSAWSYFKDHQEYSYYVAQGSVSSNREFIKDLTTYTLSGSVRNASGDNLNCSVSSPTITIADSTPTVDMPTLRQCNTANQINLDTNIFDHDGIDDISYINFEFFDRWNNYIGLAQIKNSTAQINNNWRFDQSASFDTRIYYDGLGSKMYVHLNNTLTGNGNSGGVSLSLTERPGFNMNDLKTIKATVFDSQGFKIKSSQTKNIDWVSPPDGTVSWTPEEVTDPDTQTPTVSWDTNGSSCSLKVTNSVGDACITVDEDVSCIGTKSISLNPNTVGGDCKAVLTINNPPCGSDTISSTLKVTVAEPWLMTVYGDAYVTNGYNSMKMWKKTDFQVPNLYTLEADFSTYIVSSGTGTQSFPNRPSVYDYLLSLYHDDNADIVGGVAEDDSVYAFLYKLSQKNSCPSSVCHTVTVSSFPATCDSGVQIYFVDDINDLRLPIGWAKSGSDPARACVIIAKGNVIIPASIDSADVFILSDGEVNVELDTQTLVLYGSVISEDVSFNRDLPNDAINPAQVISYESKYLILLREYLGEVFPFQVKEYGYSGS